MSPAAHRLLDHVLDRRLVDDRQHLLGLALRRREEPRAEPGGGDDRLRSSERRRTRARPVVAGVPHRRIALEAVLLAADQPAQVRRRGGRRRAARAPVVTTTSRPLARRRAATDDREGDRAARSTRPTPCCRTRAITNQTTASPSAISGKSTTSTPPAVATPRPPLNRRVTGKHVAEDRGDAEEVRAAVPVDGEADARRRARPCRCRASEDDQPGLPARAAGRRSRRPGCPTPRAVTSCPSARATRIALGNVPSRYATGRGAARRTAPIRRFTASPHGIRH